MAEKRMFARSIIDSDVFLEMPMSARLLYYDLGMRADDDGFVNSPRKIMRVCGNTDDDLKILIAKKFIIIFENGIIVIKHWRLNNYLRKDRYTPTNYTEEMNRLSVEQNNSYSLKEYAGIPSGIPVVDRELSTSVTVDVDKSIQASIRALSEDGIPSGIPVVDVDKNRIDKSSIGKISIVEEPEKPKRTKRKDKEGIPVVEYAEFVHMTEEEYGKLVGKYGVKKADGCIQILNAYKGSTGKTYKSDYMTMFSWVAERYDEDELRKSKKPLQQKNGKERMEDVRNRLKGIMADEDNQE